MMGAMAPSGKAQTRTWYVASGPKNSLGPTTPQSMEPLKCTRARGQTKPFMAWGVQMLGTLANIQFRIRIWVMEDTTVAAIWTEKRMRGGIFM